MAQKKAGEVGICLSHSYLLYIANNDRQASTVHAEQETLRLDDAGAFVGLNVSDLVCFKFVDVGTGDKVG